MKLLEIYKLDETRGRLLGDLSDQQVKQRMESMWPNSTDPQTLKWHLNRFNGTENDFDVREINDQLVMVPKRRKDLDPFMWHEQEGWVQVGKSMVEGDDEEELTHVTSDFSPYGGDVG